MSSGMENRKKSYFCDWNANKVGNEVLESGRGQDMENQRA